MSDELSDLQKELIGLVDGNGDNVAIYSAMRKLVARDLVSAEDDDAKRDFYKLFLALQKEVDKKNITDDADEDENFLEALAADLQNWNKGEGSVGDQE